MQLSDTNWWKWGEASKRKALTDYPSLHAFLQQRFGTNFNDTRSAPADFNAISRQENVALIRNIFQADFPSLQIAYDENTRLQKSLGKSYADLLFPLHNLPVHLPDAVAYPASHDEVLRLVKICSDKRIQVVPFGGGSNVVGSFKMKEYASPRLVVAMSKMDALLTFDEDDHTAVFQCGIQGPALEAALNKKGFTLGHFPQSFEHSSLGGWIVTRSAGQESSFYGRIDHLAIALKVATPLGTITTSPFEEDAEGVNIKSLFLGSEGMFGIVTEAKVRIHLLPKMHKWLVAVFPSFEQGTRALKNLVQADIHPTVVRYSDETETSFLTLLSHSQPSSFAQLKQTLSSWVLRLKGITTPTIMMVRLSGEEEQIEETYARAATMFRKEKALLLGQSLGKKWEGSRFGLPYLRDDLMERGIFVDTMETVLPWKDICPLKHQLTANLQRSTAFRNEKGILLAHLSHVYPSASSIYFTVITTMNRANPYEQWEEIKAIVTDTIVNAGGAVSHHHSIGRDHQAWYVKKTDPLTREILKSIKQTIDPNSILNPGKLYDE